jgi:hypothetical protein
MAFVQVVSSATGSVTLTVTAGDTLVGFFNPAGGVTVSSVADSQGNTWVVVGSVPTTGAPTVYAAYALNCAGGSTVVTATGSGGSTVINDSLVVEESGITSYTGASSNANQSAPGTGTNAITSGTVTTASTSSTMVGLTVNGNNNTDTVSAGTGFTSRGMFWTAGNNSSVTLEDGAISGAGSYAATFTAVGNSQYENFSTWGLLFSNTVAGGAVIAWIT